MKRREKDCSVCLQADCDCSCATCFNARTLLAICRHGPDWIDIEGVEYPRGHPVHTAIWNEGVVA